MSALGILHVLLAAYLSATLCATALAKLRNRQTSYAGMMRESFWAWPAAMTNRPADAQVQALRARDEVMAGQPRHLA
jgi:hypothetical protein